MRAGRSGVISFAPRRGQSPEPRHRYGARRRTPRGGRLRGRRENPCPDARPLLPSWPAAAVSRWFLYGLGDHPARVVSKGSASGPPGWQRLRTNREHVGAPESSRLFRLSFYRRGMNAAAAVRARDKHADRCGGTRFCLSLQYPPQSSHARCPRRLFSRSDLPAPLTIPSSRSRRCSSILRRSMGR